MPVNETLLSKINKKLLEKFLLTLVLNLDLLYGAAIVSLCIVVLKNALELANQTNDVVKLSNQNKDGNKFPPIPPNRLFPEKSPTKRILALHLCSPYYINQYVIFKKKIKII